MDLCYNSKFLVLGFYARVIIAVEAIMMPISAHFPETSPPNNTCPTTPFMRRDVIPYFLIFFEILYKTGKPRGATLGTPFHAMYASILLECEKTPLFHYSLLRTRLFMNLHFLHSFIHFFLLLHSAIFWVFSFSSSRFLGMPFFS